MFILDNEFIIYCRPYGSLVEQNLLADISEGPVCRLLRLVLHGAATARLPRSGSSHQPPQYLMTRRWAEEAVGRAGEQRSN